MIWLHLLLGFALTDYAVQSSNHYLGSRVRRQADNIGPPSKKLSPVSLPRPAPISRGANRPSGDRGSYAPCAGSCTVITNCEAHEARVNDLSPENQQFLKKIICNVRGSTTLYCCPPLTGVSTDTFVPPSVQKAQEEGCGISNFQATRVVGGSPAGSGDWPWAVAIFVDNHFSCGGTLINHNFILTAAHCVISASHGGKQIPTSSYTIHLGDLDLYSEDDRASPVVLKLIKAVAHPNFRLSNFHNDVAVMQLERPVQFNEFIKPACLPNRAEVNVTFQNTGAVLVGWGTTGFEKAAASHLQYVIFPIQPWNKCVKAYEAFRATHPIIETQLCAGLLTGRKDACQGDSGGPLVIMDPYITGNPWTLVGIVSYGFKCAEVGYPGIYTRVTSFLDWIEENTKL